VTGIVEQKDATPEQLKISEINTGNYCFEADALFNALEGLTCDNAQKEYYLTDVLAILAQAGRKVGAVRVADFGETLGINSRVQLAEAEAIMRRRKLVELMESGVTVMDPASTFVDAGVSIGRDTILYPFTWIEGNTVIGEDCRIGPNTRISDSILGNAVTLHFSYVHECKINEGAIVGPYVHLRPDTELMPGVKVGNFVEIKNSQVGRGSKVPHLSYIGDTDIGSGVNIGCGSITVNYDGKKKHRTTIGNDAFIGCNSNLVAPVTVGEGAYIAAGSTITKEVPPRSLGVGRARQTNIAGWVENKK
jgi:bifunctional UDP-N-acetylglucosamine pyrophosphorylase/glucosamine-1-phosphate N-acetyltransferase